MGYVSEHTKFIREMMEKNPQWREDQLYGRSLLWDKKVDFSAQRKLGEVTEQQKPYPYDVNFFR